MCSDQCRLEPRAYGFRDLPWTILSFGALIYCSDFKLLGPPTISPGNAEGSRGRLAMQQIEVGNSPLADGVNAQSSLEQLCAADDDFLADICAAVRDGTPLPEPPKSTLVRSRFVMRWEEQTRPPLQKCWLLSEVFACERTKLQVLNEGGEEFDGEDA